MSSITSDWANWDSPYQFAADHNQTFVKTDLIVFHPEPVTSMFVELHIQPIRWDEQDSYLVTLHDMTVRKMAEEEIRKLNQSLEQRVVERTISN